MKMKMKKNISLVILVSLLFVGWNTFQKNDFIFQRGNQKMIIKLENGQSYIKWNVKSKLIIKLENIDPIKLSFAGPGISNLKIENSKEEVQLDILVPKQNKERGILKYFVSGKDSKDSTWTHYFSIQIKNH